MDFFSRSLNNVIILLSNIKYHRIAREEQESMKFVMIFFFLPCCIFRMLSWNLGLLLVINKLPAWFNHYSNRFFLLKLCFFWCEHSCLPTLLNSAYQPSVKCLLAAPLIPFMWRHIFSLLKLLQQVIKDESKSLIKIQINCSMQGKNPIFLEYQNISLGVSTRESLVHILYPKYQACRISGNENNLELAFN